MLTEDLQILLSWQEHHDQHDGIPPHEEDQLVSLSKAIHPKHVKQLHVRLNELLVHRSLLSCFSLYSLVSLFPSLLQDSLQLVLPLVKVVWSWRWIALQMKSLSLPLFFLLQSILDLNN